MPSRVYSTSFISKRGVNGTGPRVTVPPGHVYVVKQLTFFSDPSLGVVRGNFKSYVSNATLFACATPSDAGLPTPAWFGFYGTLVFEVGDTFGWETSSVLTDAADVGAFGFDLLSE